MRKSVKAGNRTFIHLTDETLYLDQNGSSELFPLPFDAKGKVLDFFYDGDDRKVKIITKDGKGITSCLDDLSDPTIVQFDMQFISASISYDNAVVVDSEYLGQMINFSGEVLEKYTDIPQQMRFCLYTDKLVALADSSVIHVHKENEDCWHVTKFRQFFIRSLFNVNSEKEFGVKTSVNTRICRRRFQTVFRSWAINTECLLRCPCERQYFAHLDKDGTLRVGDNESDFTFQESNVTGICWEMGILWYRDTDAKWTQLVMAFQDQLFDLRTTKLEGMEAQLKVNDTGKVVEILEALRERPAMAPEIMKILPPVAQTLTAGIIVNEVKYSLDAYIKKGESIYELLGQIELALQNANE